MPPYRVLYVDLAPGVGGSVISLYQLLKGLDRRRYAPHVVLRAGNGYCQRFQELGVPVMTLGSSAPTEGEAIQALRAGRLARWAKRSAWGERLVHGVGFYLRAYPTLRREAHELSALMQAVRPHLVHLNDVVCVSRAGIMAARAAGVPAICHLRAMAQRNHFDRRLSRSLRGFIAISEAVARHERALGGRVEPCWVVYNGVDLAEFAVADDPLALRAELGLAPEDQVVGCVGRLVAWKGQHILLRALAELAPARPRLRGLVVGAPEAQGQEYADALRALARELALEDRLIWTGFRQDIPRLLRAMDLLAHTSIAPEPFGRVLIEAMAAGTPVIASDAGAVPEIITHGATGLLVPPGQAAPLAQAIAWALDHPQERAAWQGAARRAVEERFSLAAYVEGVERVYEEMLK